MARTVRGSESTRIGRASGPLMLVLALAVASLVAAAPANAATRDIRVHFTQQLRRGSDPCQRDAGRRLLGRQAAPEGRDRPDGRHRLRVVRGGDRDRTHGHVLGRQQRRADDHALQQPLRRHRRLRRERAGGICVRDVRVIEDRTTKFKCDCPRRDPARLEAERRHDRSWRREPTAVRRPARDGRLARPAERARPPGLDVGRDPAEPAAAPGRDRHSHRRVRQGSGSPTAARPGRGSR